MAENEVFQTRLDPDEAAHVHRLMDERRISKAEATRRLIRAGIAAREQAEQEDADLEEQNDLPERVEVAFRWSDYLANGGLATIIIGFLGWVGLVAGVLPVNPLTVALAAMTFFGFVGVLFAFVLVVALSLYEAATGAELATQVRDVDIRRWLAT